MATVETPYIYTGRSFRYLFDRFKNQLYSFVLAIVRQPCTAAQITHDIFLRLWQCRDILREINDLDEHIFATACNIMPGHADTEGMLSVPMRHLWEELKIQPVEYPVECDQMYVWMNQGEAGEESWGSVWKARLIALVFLLMAAALAYFSITMK